MWALASDNQTAAKRRLSVPRASSWLFLSPGTRGFGTLRCHIGSITVVKTPCWKDPEREMPEDRELHLLQLRRHTWEGRASETSLAAPEL